MNLKKEFFLIFKIGGVYIICNRPYLKSAIKAMIRSFLQMHARVSVTRKLQLL